MEIHLPPDIEAFVQKGIENGRFSNYQTALLEGLSLLQERDAKLAWLKAEIQIGIDQLERGEYITLETDQLDEFFEDIKRRGRERLAKKNKN